MIKVLSRINELLGGLVHYALVHYAREIVIATIAGILTAVIIWTARSVLGEIFQYLFGHKARSTQIALLLIISTPMFLWLWRPSLLETFRPFVSWRWYWACLTRLALTVCVVVLGGLTLLLGIDQSWRETEEVYKLFPQARQYNPAVIRTYATNGSSSYSFYDEKSRCGPNGFAKITFRVNRGTEADNAGWVIFLLRGEDISKFSQLNFCIRGDEGGEKVGVKAKDAAGAEVAINLTADDKYLRGVGLSKEWEIVTIPLKRFGEVDFGLFENLSLFSTGAMAGAGPQVFYVGEFELK